MRLRLARAKKGYAMITQHLSDVSTLDTLTSGADESRLVVALPVPSALAGWPLLDGASG